MEMILSACTSGKISNIAVVADTKELRAVPPIDDKTTFYIKFAQTHTLQDETTTDEEYDAVVTISKRKKNCGHLAHAFVSIY